MAMRTTLGLFLLIAAAPAMAQDASWKGESVLPVKQANEIKLRQAVGGKEMLFPYSGYWPVTVRDDAGSSIRIYDSYREGWAEKADFVLVKDAAAYFDRRVKAKPKDAFAWYMRGNGRWQKGDLDDAISDFNECIKLAPNDVLCYNSRGGAWHSKKEYDKAIADFSKAIQLNPKYALAYRNRARTWDAKKDYGKALADLNQAILLDPKYIPALQATAWLLATCPNAKLRNGKRAVELAKKAVGLDNKNANLLEVLAAAHACAGNFTEAVRLQERVLEDPQFENNAAAKDRLELYRKKEPYRQE